MDEIEKMVADQATELVKQTETKTVDDLIAKKLGQTDNLKQAIDFAVTKTALEEENTQEVLKGEKKAELENDARAKRTQAETNRTVEETKRVFAEKEKQIAEFDKQITARQKEVEQLKAEADKAQAFYTSNKDILKYIGVRDKKSLKTMQVLMFPATIIFIIVQILMFPLTLCGVVLETVIDIIGGVSGSIKNNALKIIISIAVMVLVVGIVVGVYILGVKLIKPHII